MTSAEFADPFQPAVPLKGEQGRLFTHRQLVAGWPCRHCLAPLAETPTGGLLCLHCDPLAAPKEGHAA